MGNIKRGFTNMKILEPFGKDIPLFWNLPFYSNGNYYQMYSTSPWKKKNKCTPQKFANAANRWWYFFCNCNFFELRPPGPILYSLPLIQLHQGTNIQFHYETSLQKLIHNSLLRIAELNVAEFTVSHWIWQIEGKLEEKRLWIRWGMEKAMIPWWIIVCGYYCSMKGSG